ADRRIEVAELRHTDSERPLLEGNVEIVGERVRGQEADNVPIARPRALSMGIDRRACGEGSCSAAGSCGPARAAGRALLSTALSALSALSAALSTALLTAALARRAGRLELPEVDAGAER